MIATKLRTARELAPLVRRDAAAIAYIGWLGHHNLGDEAMYEACRRELGAPVVRLPSERALACMRAAARGPVFRAGLLGGGTVVGWSGYRARIERLLRHAPDARMYALGVGVLEPEHRYGVNGDVRAELRRWAEPLSRFERVTVRGERSRELLAGIGVDAAVVGDTALLLADEVPHDGVEQGLLGLNVGVAATPWDDERRVLRELAAFAADARARGWRIRLVSVWPKDDAVTAEVARSAGGAEVVQGWRDLDRTLAALRECQVFVGVKLHSVVLASGAHVPSVMVEYQPKCREFQDSIGRGDWSLPAERATAGEIGALVDELASGWSEHRERLGRAVAELRGRLRRELAAIAASSGLSSP